jgi:anti-sigma B factor antagonist
VPAIYEDARQVTRAGSPLLVCRGEIDLHTAVRFEGSLFAVVDGCRSAAVVVDLSEVTFIDSTGLTVLVRALRRIRERDCSLVVVATNRSVLKILRVSGLDQVFRLVSSRDEVE